MADLFQGAALPSVVTTTEKATQAPEFYTNYLQDIANLGQSAVAQGGIAGFSPLQQQAFQMAPDVAFSGAGSLGAASQLAGQAGATTVPDVIGQYLNPYTSNVVNEMARLQQRQIQEGVLPRLGASFAGTGQFGSRRAQQITGNVLRDLQADLLGKQYQALQQGYGEATKAAQSDLQRALDASRAFTSLGQEQQQLGLGGLKAMSEYGGQQQALGQKMLDYPMAQAKAFSELMRGYTMPTADVTQITGPQAGAYSSSPLAQIAGLLTGLGALYGRSTGAKAGGSIRKMAKGGLTAKKSPPPGAAYRDEHFNYYDDQGYLVR